MLEDLTLGPGAAADLIEAMHGAGSTHTQRVMLGRLADVDSKMSTARKLAGESGSRLSPENRMMWGASLCVSLGKRHPTPE